MRIILLLMLLPFMVFGQMKREVLSYNGVRYLKYTPKDGNAKGVVLFLHGQGERSNTDISLLERTEIPKQLKAGLEVPYIVIAPQLPANLGGWYGNITYPIIDLLKTFKMDMHITGLSLGAMQIPSLIAEKPGVFKTAASVCGFVNGSDAKIKATIFEEFRKIPSIFYYDPGDYTIAYGWLSVKEIYDKLSAEGRDITLVTYPGKGHSIWQLAYQPVEYWAWLDSKVTPPVPVPPDPVIKTEVIAGAVVFTTQSGKTVTLKP